MLLCKQAHTRGPAIAEGPRDALCQYILSTAAQLHEKSHLKSLAMRE